MAYFDTVTTFFHQLDNMEAIFRLYNLGNLIGVLQVESHIGKCRIQITASCKWHFTTIDSRTTVVGVQTCQHREAFSLIHTIRIFAQTTFYIFNFLQRNFRLLCDDLHLYLGRDIRNTVLRQILEVAAHLCRSDFNLSYQFLLHSLHFQSFTGILTQGFTNLTGCLIEVFLHLFTRTDIGDIHIRHLVHTLDHLTFSNFNTIESSLVQKQLLYSYFFRNHTVGITIKFTSFVQSTHPSFFYFRLQYSLVAHYPNYFVNHVVLSINGRTGHQRQGT